MRKVGSILLCSRFAAGSGTVGHLKGPTMDRCERLSEDDGPFTYVYLAVTAVPGMLYPTDAAATIPFHSFEEHNARAFLTMDWDAYCAHMDQSNGIAMLLLTAFRGRRRFGWLSEYEHRFMARIFGTEAVFLRNLKREAAAARSQRHKEKKSPGCYLIYQAEGELMEPVDFTATRRIGSIGVGLDAIRREPYRETHGPALHAAATGLSLLLAESNGSPNVHFVGDIIYLKGKDDLTFYSRTVEMGNVSATVSSRSAIDGLGHASEYIPAMLSDYRIDAAISLFAQSQSKENDNLRSFIAAWSALELTIDRLHKVTWPSWQERLYAGVICAWNKNLKGLPARDYRLRDRFFAVACVLDQASASADAAAFTRVNDMRNRYYHRMAVKDRDLPTDEVRVLFRKYLKLGLTYSSEGGPNGSG